MVGIRVEDFYPGRHHPSSAASRDLETLAYFTTVLGISGRDTRLKLFARTWHAYRASREGTRAPGARASHRRWLSGLRLDSVCAGSVLRPTG